MKKLGLVGLLLAVALTVALLPAAVLAQDGNRVPLSGGYTISLPDGWELDESEGVYTFSQDDLSIFLTLPGVLVFRLDLNEDMDAADVLVQAYSVMVEQTLDKDTDIQMYSSGERAMATHRFEKENGTVHGISVVLEVAPGEFALMEFQAPADQYVPALPDAFNIMESLQVGEAATGVSAEPCQVRATLAHVDLRVGPGTNRGIYTTMASGPYFGVLGKKTLSDGSLWWRLDMDTGSANELWVADTDVETTGNCELVQDVDAPPLIFGPPPAPPATGGEDTGEAAPTPNPSKIPANGNWSIVPASEFMASCEGGPTERYSTAELGIEPFTAQITASPDGYSLTWTDPGGTFVFYGRDGYYQWGYATRTAYVTWHLYVSSPTQMRADIGVAFKGEPCSATVPVSVQYLG
jgi:hypothetical protein